MSAMNPLELAQVMWETNMPGAQPLAEQEERTQAIYLKATKAVIARIVQGSTDTDGPLMALLHELAEQLAYKYNNPGHFVDGVRETFDNYAAVVGESALTDQVKAARKI